MKTDGAGESFDLVVIGGGPGGYVAAIRAAQLGWRTLCVDRHGRPGGTCLLEGCIPSKTLLETARLFREAQHLVEEHGIEESKLSLDVKTMMERKEKVVDGLSQGIAHLFRKAGVEFVTGEARVEGPGAVAITSGGHERKVKAERILLAVGSRPAELFLLPVDGHRILHSGHVLSFKRVPRHLIIVGGGVIGLELGSLWLRLGSKVTVVEMLPEILPGMDQTLVRHLTRQLRKEGMQFLTGVHLVRVIEDEDGISLVYRDREDREEVLAGTRILVSAGRVPNSDVAGIPQLGLLKDAQGRLLVDDQYATSVPGIYAIGDLTPGPMLAHRASEEGIVMVERAAGLQRDNVRLDTIPQVLYTDPELAAVGLTEEQARQQGLEVVTGSFPLQANGRARSMGKAEGLVKVVARAEDNRLLGVHILAPHAGEWLSTATLAIKKGMTAQELGRLICPHPSLAEALKEAAMAAGGKAIHL
ncbi:MAG: dihydrolipoyl dehydrogenase [Magnetococcales bacterium]|nr:dihydrolipoyl dehydrogenase [Magnetococcales bacterium]